MKKLIIGLLFLCQSIGFAAWQCIGPYGGGLNALGVAPSNNNILYTATQTWPYIIYKSTNAADSWTNVSTIENPPFFITVDPANPDIVYAGYYNVLYKSTNGGTSWSSSPMADNYYDLVVHPTQPNILYAAGESNDSVNHTMAFFKSTDAGLSWSHVHLNSFAGQSTALCADPADPNTIYVGGYYFDLGYYPSVYKSTNGGTTFNDVSSGIPPTSYVIYSLAVHPTDPNIVYAGAFSIIYRSTVGGGSWSAVYAPDGYVWRLATTPANPNAVYASADTAVYMSTDSGVNWSVADSGLAGDRFSCLAAHNTNGNTVFTASSTGFFKSMNAGQNWSRSVAGMNMATIISFGIASSTIFTESYGTAIFKTNNNGTTWAALPSPMSCGNICAFAIQKNNPDVVCILEGFGCYPTELYKTTDGGSVWTMIDGYYDDGGALIMDPNDSLVYYSGGTNGGLMAVSKTTDGGSSWSRTDLTATWGFTYALAVDPSNSNNVYAAGDPALYKSADAGTNWTLSSTGMRGIVRAIAVNPANGDILYAGTDMGVFKSTDAGTNWNDSGLDSVQAILVNPSAPGTVFAGTKTGVYRSTNSGSTWSAMNLGLDNLDITSLGINQANYLFCGTRGSSMYRDSLLTGVEEQRISAASPSLTINPNPFLRFTQIRLHLVSLSTASLEMKENPHCMKQTALKIYDASGRVVKTFKFAITLHNTGDYPLLTTITWDGTDDAGEPLPAGIYFCSLKCGGITAIEKMILLE